MNQEEMPMIRGGFANQINAYDCANLTTSGATADWSYFPQVSSSPGTSLGGSNSGLTNALIKYPGFHPIKEIVKMKAGRLVRVFIVDPDKKLKIENRLIYKSDEMFTDMNDQDLFFEIEIKSLLKKHNDMRSKLKDEKKVALTPVRVSDLKMVVAVIAEF